VWGELAFSLKSGNAYLWCIVAVAFVATVCIFERFIMLQFVYNIDFSKFLINIKKMIASEDYERASNFCRSVSKSSLPKIALHALEAIEHDPTSVKGVLEEDTIDLLPKIEGNLNVLPALATFTMLIGVLGTIDQLWWAFHSIDVLDTAKKQASIATGIASALNPTAMGLLVCILLLMVHQFLRLIASRILDEIHKGVAVLHNLLVPSEVAYYPQSPARLEEVIAKQSMDASAHDTFQNAKEEVNHAQASTDSVEDIKDEEEII
jgi:biopolymer transport protein ExbB/TolQ